MTDDNTISTPDFDDDFDGVALDMGFDSMKQDLANLQESRRKGNNLLGLGLRPAVVPEILAAGGWRSPRRASDAQ